MTRVQKQAMITLAACAAALTMWLWVHSYAVSGHDIARLASSVRLWTLPLLLVLLATNVGIAAVRWSKIEVALGGERPAFGRAFSAGAVALGLGIALPGLLTNVAARGISNRLGGSGAVRGAVSGSIDQLADLAIVLLFVPAAVLGVAARSLTLYIAAVAVTAAIGFCGLTLVPAVIRRLSFFRPPAVVGGRFDALCRREVVRAVYGLSLIRFGCLTAITLLIHYATNAATVEATVIAIPLVTIAISAAMLPGGLGVSEWSFSAVFAIFGIAHQDIVLFVLGNRILLSSLAMLLMLLTLCYLAIRARRSVPKKAPLPLGA